MSSRRVGQGRVYVNLGQTDVVDFGKWCQGLAAGRSYVSDGYVHAFDFKVRTNESSASPGEGPLELAGPATITASAAIRIAPETPEAVAYGTQNPPRGRVMIGDTVNLHQPRTDKTVRGGRRLIELVVNGRVVDSTQVPADGKPHLVEFKTRIASSSWVAIRQFPQMHTNPVVVQVAGRPIRASRNSALWCIDCIELLWLRRSRFITESERPAARAAYDRARARFRKIAKESVNE